MKKIAFILLVQVTIAYQTHAHVGLLHPTGGETFNPGDTVLIRWEEIVSHDTQNWDLYFSSDGGSAWDTIQVDISVEIMSYRWIVPDIITVQGKIRIVQDNVGDDYEDVSDNFTIAPPGGFPLVADAGNDTIFCSSNLYEVTLGGNPTARGGTPPYSYSWSCEIQVRSHIFYASLFLNDTTVANPSFKGINDTITFHLQLTDSNDSIDVDSVSVIFSDFIFCLGECRETIAAGDSVQLHHCIDGGILPYNYNWTPFESLSDSTIENPWASPVTTTTYELTLTDSAGCKASGSCQVTVIPDGVNNRISEKNSIAIREKYDLVVVDLMDLNTSDSEFRIYSTNGSLVGAFRLNGEKQLDIPKQFVPGIYIYSFQNKEVLLSGRFSIINH
ncbi:MAG: hypothetical protein ISS19_16340 [Bacteroidales bacterium]|nr:hypothetical protein [Bacteroidales bacterium]